MARKKYARPPRKRKYPVDKLMTDYLSSMANRAHFEERVAFLQRQQSHGKVKLFAGWKRRLLMDLIFPDPAPYLCERPEPEKPVLPKKERPPMIAESILSRIVNVQRGKCYLCGEPFSEDRGPSRDHVVPVSAGGKNAQNILAAHRQCNADKGNRMPYPCEAIYLAGVYARLAKLETRARRKVAA